MKKNNKGRGITLSKSYYGVTVIKTVWCCQRDRHREQQNRTETPERDGRDYAQLIFGKGVKAILGRKERLFNKWCWNHWMSIGEKKVNLDPNLTSSHTN